VLHSTLVPIAAFVAALTFAGDTLASFGFEDVATRARLLAAVPFKAPAAPPKEIQSLNYDQYRDIRFNPERSLWRGTKQQFEIAFFHMGWYFDRPVRIHEITAQGVREIRFDPGLFDYGANRLAPEKLKGLGFAGFRAHFPVNTPKYKDEVLAFLGASYFRALGKGQGYGLSARGLAIDTGVAGGEEFPYFSEFWIERPKPPGNELVVFALLDSRRATGAYRFVLTPGTETVMTVKTRIYLREKVARLGIAPLTSMFYFGENQRAARDDFRPEVHDSDGLSVQLASGEWLWRPLTNPKRLLATSFATTHPKGFGLMQRDRAFESYEDLEARYEKRPSAWVEPIGEWGAGRVELVQIPSADETNDNIVAFWMPDKLPAPGQPLDFEYRLRWQLKEEARPALSWVTQTRRGHGYLRKPDDSIAFSVDFDGPALRKLPAEARVEGVVSADANGQLLSRETFRNEATGGYRVALRVKRVDAAKPVELRGFLRNAEGALSETWAYALPPD
jgi:glucans biosynthesis protein